MNIKEEISGLRQGQCLLYNEKLGKVIRFKNIFDAAKNALNHGRHNGNGWKMVDDIEVEYPSEEWQDLADVEL